MSANLLVDLFNTCLVEVSVAPAAGVGATPASGVIIGQIIDCQNANTYTNVFGAAGPTLSGPYQIQVQTSDSTTSGSFTDPTSGLATFPGAMTSGGLVWCASGSNAASGSFNGAAFLLPHRYLRVNVLSGSETNAPVTTGVIKQRRTTGSGGGFTYSPGSGTVNV